MIDYNKELLECFERQYPKELEEYNHLIFNNRGFKWTIHKQLLVYRRFMSWLHFLIPLIKRLEDKALPKK